MALPKDPIILLSYINTQLRDNYSSLEEFCKANDADSKEIETKMASINYYYNPETNSFV